MRKFYKTVSVGSIESEFAIHLDGKPVKTPSRNLLTLCTQSLAEAVAAEWWAQGETVDPHSMPLTQLASTAIDRVTPNHEAIINGLVDYAATDLLCYRALEPEALVKRQSDLFDPLLDWFEERSGTAMVVARGLMPVEQPVVMLDAVHHLLEPKSAEELTAIQLAASLGSSLVIALALAEDHITAQQAYETANVEELHQLNKWGEDDEARARLDTARREFEALWRFMDLARK